MTHTSHLLIGMVGYLAWSSHTGGEAGLATLAAAGLGSLMPDIDHPDSQIGRLLWPISQPVARLLGRRGVTHSLLLVAALAALAHHLEPPSRELAVAFGIGYGLHIAADLLNQRGVALLFPLQARFRAPVTVRTGGAGEAVITTLILGAAAVSIMGWAVLPF